MNSRSILPHLLTTLALINCTSNSPPKAPAADETSSVEPVEFESQRYGRTSEDADMAVKATFETSASSVSPSRTFMLAAHFKIAEGYQLSWTNPGAKGEEMSIEFSAPEGFEISAPMFPGPKKYVLQEGHVSYGYDGETAVFSEVTVPANVRPDEAYRFELSAKWLACKTSCLRESASAYFELVASPAPEDEGFAEPLPKLLESVPRPLASLGDTSLEWRSNKTLAIRASGVTWKDFFPAKVDQPELSEMRILPEGGRLELQFAQAPAGAPVQGVLLAEVDGKPRYVTFNETLPSAE